ncbi:MAG: Uma2 family endonuclease [Anaerolineae bacterium]|nr:Uma2 family endonuclease [Anaerolineae bacterium]
MADVPDKVLLTGDDLLNMPATDERHELIEGELITMPPPGSPHARTQISFGAVLWLYEKKSGFGRAFGDSGYHTRGDNQTVRAPDAAFISYARLPADQQLEGYLKIAPELVVEVISPNDSAKDVEAKVLEWLEFGVAMVLLAYPGTQRIHVYTAPEEVKIYKRTDTISGGDVLPGLEIKVQDIF